MNDNERKRQVYLQKARLLAQKGGRSAQRAKSWLNDFWNPPPDDEYKSDPKYLAALKYYQDFKKKEEVEYDPIVQYVRVVNEACEKANDKLDEKAESIIKNLGGGFVLITAASIFSNKFDNQAGAFPGVLLLFFLPSLWFVFSAVLAAIKARSPQLSAQLPDVPKAIEITEYNKTTKETDVNLWLVFYPICEAAFVRNDRKSALVKKAYASYRRAIILLAIPLLVILLRLCGALYFL